MYEDKVFWREGLFLQPQHLQQQDRHTDFQIRTRFRLLTPYAWGFAQLEVDPQYLALGKLVISRAWGILPDGTLFETDTLRGALTLDLPSDISNQLIYLTAPIVVPGGVEGRMPEQTDIIARYIFAPVETMDTYSTSNAVLSLECARLALELKIGEQADAAYIKMPVALVQEMTTDGAAVLDKNFSPTYLNVAASEYLSSLLREIIALLARRSEVLAATLSGGTNSGTAEIADFLLLQTINRNELLFRHLVEMETLHPETFYTHLLAMVGEISTFAGGEKRPPSHFSYDHGDQYKTFQVLMTEARSILSMVLEQHAIELPLQPRKYGISVSPIQDRQLFQDAEFILAVSADLDMEEIRSTLPQQLKIGPVERIRDLVNLHLPGIALRPLPVAPRQIPFHAGKTYFRLDLTSDDLAQLERSGGFAFHISGVFPGLSLNFWAIRE